MARKKYQEEHENHERWLVSYADFITLLFAFFVVMYALSTVNEGKYRILSDSMINAFRNTQVNTSSQVLSIVPTPIPVLPKNAPPDKAAEAKQKQRDKMRNIAKDILKVMAPLIEQGKVRVLETSRGVSIEINDSVLFSPGQAIIQAPLAKAMSAISEVLAPTDFPITIEGHTDNLPIKTAQFPSNWELSAVRATTVLRLFADSGVAPTRLTAIGYAETRPVEDNQLAEGRARNRRVAILIDSNVPEKAQEVALDTPAAAPTQPLAAPANPTIEKVTP